MIHVLITGADGFTARHLVNHLRATRSVRIAGIGLMGAPSAPCDSYRALDLADPRVAESLREIMAAFRPEWVFHLAGRVAGTATDIVGSNVLSTTRLLEEIKETAAEAKVVCVGSAAEYGRISEAELPVSESHGCQPSGSYGVTKYAQTLLALDLARQHGLHLTVVRPFNIVGAGMPASLLPGAVLARAMQAQQSRQSKIKVGNMAAERDFVAAQDVVEAYARIAEAGCPPGVYNICSGRAVPVRDLVNTLLSFFPTRLEYEVDPALVRPDDVPTMYGDYRKARQAFGFEPKVALHDALQTAWQHAVHNSG